MGPRKSISSLVREHLNIWKDKRVLCFVQINLSQTWKRKSKHPHHQCNPSPRGLPAISQDFPVSPDEVFPEANFQVTRDIVWKRFLVFSLAGDGDCSVPSLKLEKLVLRVYPSQLTILSNVLILHQPRDGWACYSHI